MLGIYCALTLAVASADPIDRLPTGSAGPATELVGQQVNQKATPEKEVFGERYLLLDNNTIVAAQKVEELSDQFRIERSGARMGLPKSKVRYVGDSLESVYRYRAERIPLHDAHMRADLAQWCFNQGLVEYAHAEALLVLKIDPENEGAKRVLKMCDTKLHPPEREPRAAATDASVARRPRDPDPSRVVKKFKAAYGQELFTRYKDLEPLLSSSCGNAACHGGIRHEGPFRLYRRTDGAPNDIRLTSRNLTSMLDAIDYHDPLRSPILYKALERHGASTLPPLGGVQDPTYVALQEWVMEVTKRWSTNEVELDPSAMEGPEEASQQERGGGFGSLRPDSSKYYVRKTGRPMRPTMAPGDEIHQMRTGPVYADDAPGESMPGIPHDSPPPRIIPDEPMPAEKMSADEMSAPMNEGRPQTDTKKQGPFRATATRLVEMVRGKPRVKQSIQLNGLQQGTREGNPFDAATPPMNLVPSFEDVNQTLHQNVSEQ
ncbi:hypothetical protein K2Y11_11295 [bacterium]|nr:hypothetical protein [bacterium]